MTRWTVLLPWSVHRSLRQLTEGQQGGDPAAWMAWAQALGQPQSTQRPVYITRTVLGGRATGCDD
jgi:hypothetical protein